MTCSDPQNGQRMLVPSATAFVVAPQLPQVKLIVWPPWATAPLVTVAPVPLIVIHRVAHAVYGPNALERGPLACPGRPNFQLMINSGTLGYPIRAARGRGHA